MGAVGALSSCGVGTGAGRVPVQLWHLFTGGDGGVFQSMIQTVQDALPEYQINPVVLTWGGPYYTKLTMASVGGRAPDLAVMHLTRIFGYAPGGLLDPWDVDRLAAMGVTEDKFQPALWERSFVDGKMYALPLDFHAFVQFYNKEICQKAGVLDGEGRLTGVDSADGYLSVGRELAKATGQQGVSYGYTSDGAQMSRMFWGLYAQTGATCELIPGNKAVFDVDAAAAVIGFVQSWLDDAIALRNQDYGSALASFSSGRSGLNWNGNWEVQTFKKAGLDLGAMPCPQIFDQPGTFGDSHVFVLPHQDVVDEERREAAYRIAAGMLQNSLDWAQGGHIPAYKDVLTSPDYLAIKPQSDYAAAMEHAVFEPQAWFTGSGSTFQGTFGVPIQEAWLNSVDPGKTAQTLQDVLNAALQTQPPA
ncbi:MAG: extracellular solute-binding protein [Arachnia sp.]